MPRESTIQIYRSTTASSVPSLTAGEMAVNIADKRLFIGGTSGNLVFRDETSSVASVNGLTGAILVAGGTGVSASVSGQTIRLSQVVTNETSLVATRYLGFYGATSGINGARIDENLTYAPSSRTIATKGAMTLFAGPTSGIAVFNNQLTLNDPNESGVAGIAFNSANGIVDISPWDFSSFSTSSIRFYAVDAFENPWTAKIIPTTLSADQTFTLPDDSGIIALTKNVATSVNGATGAVGMTGSGAILFTHSGKTGTFNARLASTSATGVASFNVADFVVGSTGHVDLTGTVARKNSDNSFSTLQTFNAGISAAGGATFSGTVASDTGYRITSNAINAQTGTSYTLTGTDNGKIVTFNNSSAVTVTIPTGLPVGFNCTAIQLGAGQVGFTNAAGLTMQSYGNQYKMIGQHASATIIEYTTNIVNLSGNLIV